MAPLEHTMIEEPGSRPERILIVEDQPDQAALLRRWLALDRGARVEVATNGQEGMELALKGDWDLLITDVELPGRSGLAIAEALKTAAPHVPVVIISAHERMDYAIRALQSKADDFLFKPLGRCEVVALADRLIARSAGGVARTRVHAIGAHPDDVEIGVGGILARHHAAGDPVLILTLSGGERGGPEDERRQESVAAARVLGAALEVGDLPDTRISEGLETIRRIRQAIDHFRPTTVYTHTPRDGHQDHRNVYQATVVAARGVANLYCYQSPSTTPEFQPTLFVNIGDLLPTKLRALEQYQTQVNTRRYLTESLIRSTAEYWGRFAGYRMVEPLEVVRESV